MSKDFSLARKKLGGISALVKQDKILAACEYFRDALVLIFRNPLMKAEREEFERLVEHALFQITGNAEFKKHYPLQVTYEPGKEKALLKSIKEVISQFQELFNNEVADHVHFIEERKKEAFKKGRGHIEAERFEKAKKVFDSLLKLTPDDTKLKSDIADEFMSVEGGHKYAFDYLDEALKHDPNALFLYNRIGMVLRKMKDFETAERYYDKALSLTENDEYLYFNAGRLYIDWQKWDKVEACALKALDINPEFDQARKMLKFAIKKMKA